MQLTRRERVNLSLFLALAQKTVSRMISQTKYPELKVVYTRILENLKHVPINIFVGDSLVSNSEGVVFGENLKKIEGGVLRSAIRIPHDHLFDSYGNIRLDGALTLLHEQSHVILPESAKQFTTRVGLPAYHTDEFFADVLSAHVAKNMGFERHVIARHLWQRRSYFDGYPIDTFAFRGIKGVREELREHRTMYRPRRRADLEEEGKPRDPFRAPREPQHILPRGRRFGPFREIGSKRERPFRERPF